MNATQKGVLTLLRSAILEQPLPLPEGFDIGEAFPLICQHHMATLAFDGAVRCGISRQEPAMRGLFQSYCKALQISEGQMREVDRICRAFQENDIDHMLLKGSRMKALYPKPELRIMGDADILIRMDQYPQIIPIMESLSFVAINETDHELVWKSEGLYLELHKRLIPSYNHNFHAYFGDGWQLAVNHEGSSWTMDPQDEFVFLFTHFSKHYRDGGIGCRHVLDLWVWLRHHPQQDETYIRRELEKLGLLPFYDNVRRLLRLWFEDGQTDEVLEYMSGFIFASGSWGAQESRVLSRTVRDSDRNLLGFNGKLVYIWNTLFPSAMVLRRKYTILQKAPWMLPVVWLIRPFYKVLFERKSLERQKREMAVLDKDSIAERREALEYVGLDLKQW